MLFQFRITDPLRARLDLAASALAITRAEAARRAILAGLAHLARLGELPAELASATDDEIERAEINRRASTREGQLHE